MHPDFATKWAAQTAAQERINRMAPGAHIPADLAKHLEVAIRAEADAQHAKYPQYRGHWDGPEWHLVRLLNTIRTKTGTAFELGDWTLARYETPEEAARYQQDYRFLHGRAGRPMMLAFSIRNGIDTSIPVSYQDTPIIFKEDAESRGK